METDALLASFRQSLGSTQVMSSNSYNPGSNLGPIPEDRTLDSLSGTSASEAAILEKYSDKLLGVIMQKLSDKSIISSSGEQST